jgi:hypothetical protein
MRPIVFVLLAAFLQPALAGPTKRIYLDRPGALEALEAENPAHFRQALEFLRAAERTPCKMLPKVIEAKFDPADFSCAPTLLMTSFPPKRQVAFTLDDTRYLAIVTVIDAGARLMPAK